MDADEATTHLSRLLAEVEAGGGVVIGRDGQPVVRLVPYWHPPTAREPGSWEGRVSTAEDVEELPDDVAAAFHGERP